jgi:hypothetical protein
MVTDLPVGEAMKGLRRELHAQGHFEEFRREHHGGHGRDRLPLLMGYDGVFHWILELRFMKVYGHIHLLPAYKLCHCPCRALGDSSIGPSRPRPVQIPYIHIGQHLAAWVVEVDLRVRPRVQGVGTPVSHTETLYSPWGLYMVKVRIGFAHTSAGGSAPARPYDHEEPSLFDLHVFGDKGSREVCSRLFGMASSNKQGRPSRHAAVENVHVAVVDCSLEAWFVIRELLHFS